MHPAPPLPFPRSVTCASALNRCAIPGIDWCVNPYVGCAHACVYCYAACMDHAGDRDQPWGRYLDARTNVAEALERQVRNGRTGKVVFSSVTDAYQPAEEALKLTRNCLSVLRGTGLAPRILTKSDRVVRDIDVLREFGGLLGDSRPMVGVSISTLDEDLAAVLEPGAPSPARRLAALSKVAEAGIRTWVFVAPVIPGLGDSPEAFEALVRSARHHGAAEIDFDLLNPYPGAVQRLRETIHDERPDLEPVLAAGLAMGAGWRERTRRVFRAILGA